MNMKRIIATIILTAFSATLIWAQNLKSSGTVKDASGNPLRGVVVSVKGGSTATVTDIDGNWQLDNVPDKRLLPLQRNPLLREVRYKVWT